jgi:hypothetical protein
MSKLCKVWRLSGERSPHRFDAFRWEATVGLPSRWNAPSINQETPMTVDGLERFPSARDIEKVARNPECRTLRTALAANVDLRRFAVHLGLNEERQSPIAIARGQQVERNILGQQAARLVEKLAKDGRVSSDVQVIDLGKRQKNREGMRQVADKTDEFLSALVQGASAPDFLIHPVLRLGLGADEQFIEPDGLLRFQDARMYQPLELKSYAYREGRTDQEDLRQARRQSAVYVHALRLHVEALGGSPGLVEPRATLVFTRPTSLDPLPVYGEPLDGEIRDVEHSLRLLAIARSELSDITPDGREITDVLAGLDIHYTERCLSFCSLAKRCRERASEDGQSSILGERSARVLGPVSIPRLLELIDGAEPATVEEASLADRFRELAQKIAPFREAV